MTGGPRARRGRYPQEVPVGLFGFGKDKDKDKDKDKENAAPADPGDEHSMTARTASALVSKLMTVGLDGLGPLDSVEELVRQKLGKQEDPEKAIDAICRSHIKMAGTGGFVTGFGGLLTMAVALPANIVEFYVLATRMVGSLAAIRGYDVSRTEVRAAILLALVGSDSEGLLRKAGVTGSDRLAQVALKRLPTAAVMMINKGVAFKLTTQIGGKAVSRLGRAVPVAGGFIGAGVDGYMMNRIADHARKEFPPIQQVSQPA